MLMPPKHTPHKYNIICNTNENCLLDSYLIIPLYIVLSVCSHNRSNYGNKNFRTKHRSKFIPILVDNDLLYIIPKA